MVARQALAAVTYFGVALFLALAFVSYDGTQAVDEVGRLTNLGGEVGESLARNLIMSFGVGAFGLAFFLLFVGYSLLIGREVRGPWIKCVGALLVMLALATTVQTMMPDAAYRRSDYPLGGIAGEYCAHSLYQYFGTLGSGLILVLLLMSALVLATDTFVFECAQSAAAIVAGAWAGRRRPVPVVEEPSDKTTARGSRAASTSRRRSSKSAEEPPAAAIADDAGFRESLIPNAIAPEVDDGSAAADDDDEFMIPPIEAVTSTKAKGRRGAAPAEESEFENEDFAGDAQIDDEQDLASDFGAGIEEDEGDGEADDDAVDPDDDAEEIAAGAPVEAPRSEPVIRTGRVTKSGDDIEILQLTRAKHMEGKEPYKLPPLTLLAEPEPINSQEREDEIRRKAHRLEEALATFGIQTHVTEISRGPTITMYEVELAAGTKVKKITSLPDDISMALKAKTVRIVAPIPGKSTVGIEVPNDVQEKVMLKELALSDVLRKKTFNIPLFLGKDAAGNALIEDLTSMPHLLIAGQTGSGKSVCINTIIASLLLTKYPDEVRLILIDPKMVELQQFRNVPHLMTPVVTDMKKAPKVLEWACSEMDQRYNLLAAAGVRDIRSFNDLGEAELRERLLEDFTPEEVEKAQKFLPYIVVVIDELADLMMMSAKEVETSICRLAQKSRAVGIHVIVATQRPSVDVITGLIKSNLPSRISFRVASKIDSRTILDQMGADRLLGHGDMLFIPPRGSSPIRCQAALVSDKEIKELVKYVKDVAQTEYSRELMQVRTAPEGDDAEFESSGERDPLYEQAIRFVVETQRGSVSSLQRKFEIGYTRAARLVDFMAEDGIVGAFKGSKAREVLMTLDQWEAKNKAGASAAQGNG